MLSMTRRQAIFLCALSLLPSTAPALAEEKPAGTPKPVFQSLGDFTVNLNDKNGQFNFIVVSVTLDVAPEAASSLKDIAPRLKEAVTRRLMTMADRGALAPGEADTEILKASLSDALHKVNSEGILEVLITRLLYG